MGRKPCVDRTRKRSGRSCREGMKSGNVSVVGDTGLRRRSTTAGKTKRNREQRQRLGREALRPRKPRRIAVSGSWNAR